MKVNKKILVLLIMSLFLVFVLIGCANNANEGGAEVNEGSPEGKQKEERKRRQMIIGPLAQ